MTTPTDGAVTLTVGNRTISGWTKVRVTRGIERCPSDFDIELTELYPDDLDDLVVQAGDAMQLSIGDDLVMTGFIDRFVPGIDGNTHDLQIAGRGSCCDLVDCAADWPSCQISGADAPSVAEKLAETYGIDVICTETDLPAIPQFNILIGETPYEVIERISRYSALLVYDQPDGSLVLARVGTDQAASGFAEGVNIERARIQYSADQRFSDYKAYAQSVDPLLEIGSGANQLVDVQDSGSRSPRLKVIIAESAMGGQEIAVQRATWEMNRRIGRSTVVFITADSWRDSSGALWAPNTLAPVTLPSLKLTDPTSPSTSGSVMMLIAEVTYRQDEQGTHTDLILMFPKAFDVEPILLFATNKDVMAGLTQ